MQKRKILVCAILLIALCTGVVAGTVSYMQYSTPEGQELVNTFIAAGGGYIIDTDVPDGFVPSDPTDEERLSYNFNLWETESKLNEYGTEYNLVSGGKKVKQITYAHVVPGMRIEKDPKINVNLVENVSAYVFVEVLDQTNANFNYEINTTYWTKLDGVTGNNGGDIYVYTDPTSGQNVILGKSTEESWYEISEATGGYIIKDNVVTSKVPLSQGTAELGTIKLYAYVCQSVGFTDASDAYQKAF